MKKRIAVGAGLLLTLGSAVAGTFLYGQNGQSGASVPESARITLPSDSEPASREVTPEMIAMWKATASSTDFHAPKAPI